MSIEENIQTLKDFCAAIGRGDKQGLLALSAQDIQWIIRPLAGMHRGHAGLADVLQKASENGSFIPNTPRVCSAGDRVLVVGFSNHQ